MRFPKDYSNCCFKKLLQKMPFHSSSACTMILLCFLVFFCQILLYNKNPILSTIFDKIFNNFFIIFPKKTLDNPFLLCYNKYVVDKTSPSGGIGRRPGLKILWEEIPVPVRPRPWAPRRSKVRFAPFFLQKNIRPLPCSSFFAKGPVHVGYSFASALITPLVLYQPFARVRLRRILCSKFLTQSPSNLQEVPAYVS